VPIYKGWGRVQIPVLQKKSIDHVGKNLSINLDLWFLS
jgi:hypothetical protein